MTLLTNLLAVILTKTFTYILWKCVHRRRDLINNLLRRLNLARDFLGLKSKKFIIEKLYFHNHAPTFNQTLQAQVERTIGLERIRTDFHRFTEIGRIFYNKYIFKRKKASQVEIWKMMDSPCLISTTIWKLMK